ncbi:MAG: hypothetical protein A2475_15070 [Ignavibacteria bacterium RIFOXYC2_FULL_35_21]|nr:MAG: hypothetical protein A2475_15070 [Ignavibacteria bacterium RIFOXYC2_FULL_35_21]
MKKFFSILLLILLITLFLSSQDTKKSVIIYMNEGNELSYNFDEINSLKILLIDSLTWVHIFYKNNHQHFIYSCIGLDSIGFDHENNKNFVVKDSTIEYHNIDSIKYMWFNCKKLICRDKWYDFYNDHGSDNPDSVLVDSCQDPPIIYVYRWFNVVFKNYVINLPAAPEDTTLDVTWEAISSSYTQLRSDFQELENKFGSYYFRKISPEITDSNHIGSRDFLIASTNML